MISSSDLSTKTNNKEGVLQYDDSLSLSLSDDEVNRILTSKYAENKQFWNKEYDLETKREQNEKYWLNTAFNESDLYEYQVTYKDNRIFTAIETLLPVVLSRPPQPIVVEAEDTDASRELAENLEKILLAHYEDLYLKQKFTLVGRHLLAGKRIGIMKYRWDKNKGMLDPKSGERVGGIAVDVIRPEKVVLDQNAKNPDDVPLISELQSCTAEELMIKFPDKRDAIWQELGGRRETSNKTASQVLGSMVGYTENWFTYFGDNGEKKEGVAWKLNRIILDKMKNPNWNYDETGKDEEGNTTYSNFFDRPKKPYVFFNYLGMGKTIMDDTSLLEQAIPMQDVLNKRGRQIVENADQASSGTVFNEDMISADSVSQLTGNPAEKVLVKGDVRQAAMRIPTSVLEPYVIEDKRDARDEIDNIFGTRDPLRDANNATKTLGQAVLSQRQDMGRLQILATSFEDGADRLYKGLVQMMKVFYDEDQMIKYLGEDGSATFISFSNEKIEDGIQVRVKTGSVLPDDQQSMQQMGVNLAPILDPLTLAELLNGNDPFKYPDKVAKRMFLMKAAPDQYYQEILGENPEGPQDPEAVSEIQGMNQGQPVQPQEDPTKEHLAQHDAFIKSPGFQQLPPDVQQAHLAHAKAEAANANKGLKNPQEESSQGQQPQGKGGLLSGIMSMLGGNH